MVSRKLKEVRLRFKQLVAECEKLSRVLMKMPENREIEISCENRKFTATAYREDGFLVFDMPDNKLEFVPEPPNPVVMANILAYLAGERNFEKYCAFYGAGVTA